MAISKLYAEQERARSFAEKISSLPKFRNEVGRPRAVEEKCVIICPWHNFEFDLDTGRSPCEPDRLRIATYWAELEEDEVVVYA